MIRTGLELIGNTHLVANVCRFCDDYYLAGNHTVIAVFSVKLACEVPWSLRGCSGNRAAFFAGEDVTLENLKILLAEAADNVLVAGCCIFLFIAFVAAIPEPKAALFPLALAALCYGVARLKDPD